ncbi:MAG: CHRD domain-containing protein [Nakamurella sp.]
MNRLRLTAVRALAVAGVCGLMLAGALPAAAATVTLSGSGSGSEEVPAGSASDKVSGTFDIDAAAGTLTYKISFQGSEPATMGHIHKGAAGTKGDVVVPFDAAVINAGGSATITVDKAVLDAIVADPAGYYVNVHTATAPGGAARGQLMTGSGTMPSAVSAGTGGQFAALHDSGNTALIALLAGAGLLVVGAAGAVTVGRRRG